MIEHRDLSHLATCPRSLFRPPLHQVSVLRTSMGSHPIDDILCEGRTWKTLSFDVNAAQRHLLVRSVVSSTISPMIVQYRIEC